MKESIISFVLTIFIAFIFGLIIVGIVDKRMSEIEIKLPKQKIVVNIPDKDQNIEEYRDFTEPDDISEKISYDINSNQMSGPRHFRDPKDMSSLDRVDHLSHYSHTFSLQDYVSWLLWNEKEGTLTKKVHKDNLNKIKNGKKLTYRDKPRNNENFEPTLYKPITTIDENDIGIKGYNIGNYENSSSIKIF